MGAAQEANRALRELLLLGKETPENLRWMSVCGKDGVLTAAVKVLSLSLSLSCVEMHT
jgi:histone demethylase JARID1